ncbi:alpha-ketoacid dehydrogenase subunit beta [Candidatus Heimdallarchaeota archaeon B3_Heim]|nr:MAG: alpha-ketoacid dehydrogenase subunit beta [Candidatus Heimdallarchaeota archaeon B3_Heim]
MPELTLVESVRLALEEELDRNDKLIVLGEDVGPNGGVFRATQGLLEKYGPQRVLDTPLSENGIIGFAIGMALMGLKPVAEIQFVDFIYPGFDQLISEAAKFRYRSGGMFTSPLVIRSPYGGGVRGAHYHSQSPEAYFTHTPGLKVVIPSSPYETKGLLTSAMREQDPILFLEPKRLYRAFKEEVPSGDYTIPLGKARIAREGEDVTILAYGAMLHVALEAAELASKNQKIECEVIDLRTLVPLDIIAIENSVKKTGRMISITESPKTSGFSAELSAIVAERWIEYMEGPIMRVTGYDTPFPLSLEQEYLPSAKRTLDTIEKVYNF